MERRIDHRFKRRYVLRTAVLLVPPLVAFAFMWSARGPSGPAFLMAAILFVVWIAVWIAIDTVTFRSYRCPSCGQTIERSAITIPADNDPIRYRCPACDVEWDTGLTESSE